VNRYFQACEDLFEDEDGPGLADSLAVVVPVGDFLLEGGGAVLVDQHSMVPILVDLLAGEDVDRLALPHHLPLNL